MHVISQTRLKKFWLKHPDAERGLRYWYKLTITHKWQCFTDIRQTFPSADFVNNFVVFNICGNNYRLITFIDFKQSKVFVRYILTHAEYDRDDWKKDDWYHK